MTVSEIFILLGAAAAIVWVNWYFLFSGGRVAEASTTGGVQEVRIRVEGGYDPATIRVKQGRQVRLVFDRQERNGCSEEVVIPAFGIRKFLPPFQDTPVTFTPAEGGSFDFTCGMGMLKGRIVVDEEGRS